MCTTAWAADVFMQHVICESGRSYISRHGDMSETPVFCMYLCMYYTGLMHVLLHVLIMALVLACFQLRSLLEELANTLMIAFTRASHATYTIQGVCCFVLGGVPSADVNLTVKRSALALSGKRFRTA